MLTDAQIERYARHVLLREVGGAGQQRLLGACVRIEGLDAPGAWAAAYLALAGVGRLQLEDPAPVHDPLPLLGPADLGAPRAAALAAALPGWNPDVRVVAAGAPDLVIRRGAASGPRELGLAVAGAEVLLAPGDACARCVAGLVPQAGLADPSAAVLGGSLAAAAAVRDLLALAPLRVQRFSGGRPVEVARCPH